MEIRDAGGTWVVRAGGAVLGETGSALKLLEADREPVIYFPRDDIAMAFLDTSETKKQCPVKGEASYYSIQTKSTLLKNAGWSYEAPTDAARPIAGYLAFDPAQVTVEQL